LDATFYAPRPKAKHFRGWGRDRSSSRRRVKRIIDLANEEASRLKDEYISTEHIFLAILSERNTPAARHPGIVPG
jgi:ATP-dependent Clp protease ATP-binding subunit ClpC